MHASLVVKLSLRVVLPSGIHRKCRTTQSEQHKRREDYPSKNARSRSLRTGGRRHELVFVMLGFTGDMR